MCADFIIHSFKNLFLQKMQNFFSFGRIFSQKLQTTGVGTWQQCLDQET
jgi:hypothetical protein